MAEVRNGLSKAPQSAREAPVKGDDFRAHHVSRRRNGSVSSCDPRRNIAGND